MWCYEETKMAKMAKSGVRRELHYSFKIDSDGWRMASIHPGRNFQSEMSMGYEYSGSRKEGEHS